MLHWLQVDIIGRGRLPLLLCLIAFIVTFAITRSCVRYIRYCAAVDRPLRWWEPRNFHLGPKHIHHVVVGVVMVMASGVTLVALSITGNNLEVTGAAIFFGIGAALVLDEYALILNLSDVYWEEDGRSSVDAVFAAVAVGGLLVLGLHPLMFFLALWQDTTHSPLMRAAVIAGMVLTPPLAIVVLLKGKVWTGLIGMFFVVLLLVAAIRLSRPHAPWARWRYTSQPDKMEHALERERSLRRPVVRAKLALQNVIAGTPRLPDARAVNAELDREVHAAPPPEAVLQPVAVGAE